MTELQKERIQNYYNLSKLHYNEGLMYRYTDVSSWKYASYTIEAVEKILTILGYKFKFIKSENKQEENFLEIENKNTRISPKKKEELVKIFNEWFYSYWKSDSMRFEAYLNTLLKVLGCLGYWKVDDFEYDEDEKKNFFDPKHRIKDFSYKDRNYDPAGGRKKNYDIGKGSGPEIAKLLRF